MGERIERTTVPNVRGEAITLAIWLDPDGNPRGWYEGPGLYAGPAEPHAARPSGGWALSVDLKEQSGVKAAIARLRAAAPPDGRKG